MKRSLFLLGSVGVVALANVPRRAVAQGAVRTMHVARRMRARHGVAGQCSSRRRAKRWMSYTAADVR